MIWYARLIIIVRLMMIICENSQKDKYKLISGSQKKPF